MPHLTKQLVMDLEPRVAPYRVFDSVVRGVGVIGFCVRVSSSKKVFGIMYRNAQKKKAWYKIGTFGVYTVEEARAEARSKMAAVTQGVDPAQAKRDAAVAKVTVNDLAARYLTDHVAVNNGAYQLRDVTRYLNRIILPVLGARPVREVGSSDVAFLLSSVRKETPVQANRVRSTLSKMFAKAELWEMRAPGTNPCVGQDKAPESKRERRLVEGEIRALGRVMRQIETAKDSYKGAWEAGDIVQESVFGMAGIRLVLLAGFRPGEVQVLQWPWIDLNEGVVTIPPEFHKTGKRSGKSRLVYLCKAAVKVLKDLPRNDGPKAHYPNPHVIQGAVHGSHLVDLDAWERIRATVTALERKAAKKARSKAVPIAIDDVVVHDLRRTFASVGADMGYPELFMSALLGHSAGSTTQIYTRVSSNPLKETAEAIGAQISEWLNG